MIQPLLHYGIHFGLPLIIALIFFKTHWKMAYLIMLLSLLIDVDHIWANPIFDTNRCSIGFHPLHSYWAIVLYFGLTLVKKTRLIGLGLIIHIIADATDCLLM